VPTCFPDAVFLTFDKTKRSIFRALRKIDPQAGVLCICPPRRPAQQSGFVGAARGPEGPKIVHTG
jgi:hypothetical protein